MGGNYELFSVLTTNSSVLHSKPLEDGVPPGVLLNKSTSVWSVMFISTLFMFNMFILLPYYFFKCGSSGFQLSLNITLAIVTIVPAHRPSQLMGFLAAPRDWRSHTSQHETTRGSKLPNPTGHADNAELLGRQRIQQDAETTDMWNTSCFTTLETLLGIFFRYFEGWHINITGQKYSPFSFISTGSILYLST